MVDIIKGLCKSKGISVNDLEAALFFKKNTIYAWQSHEPSIFKVAAVADFFGVPVDALLPKK